MQKYPIRENDWVSVRKAIQKLGSANGFGPTASPTFAGLTVTNSCVLGSNSAVFQPTVDSTTFFQIKDEDGNAHLVYDTTNDALLFPNTTKLGTIEGSYNFINGFAFAAKSGYDYCVAVGDDIANSATGGVYRNNMVGSTIANSATNDIYRNNMIGSSLADSATGSVYYNNMIGYSLADSATGNVHHNNMIGSSLASLATGGIYYNNLVGYSLANEATEDVIGNYIVGNTLANSVTGNVKYCFISGYRCVYNTTNETNLENVIAFPYESLNGSSAADLDNAIAIGYQAGKNNAYNNPALFGAQATATAHKQIVIGSSYYTGGIRLDAANVYLSADNRKIYLGTANDAEIYYDGTNLVLSPRVVGTGGVTIGAGEANVDYKLIFDGETNDGTVTFMEDEKRFDFDSLINGITGIRTKYSEANVSDPPSDAELDSAFGTPAALESAFIGILDDNSDDTDCYVCWTNDSSWWYIKGTKAT
jgi:hypothetical protein